MIDILSRFLSCVFLFGLAALVPFAICVFAVGSIANRKFPKPETKEQAAVRNRWLGEAMGTAAKVLIAVVVIFSAYVAVFGFPQGLNELLGTNFH